MLIRIIWLLIINIVSHSEYQTITLMVKLLLLYWYNKMVPRLKAWGSGDYTKYLADRWGFLAGL